MKVYYRLQLIYPHEEKFRAENFANCPLILIEQALEEAQQYQLEKAATHASPIANVGVAVMSATGRKAEPAWFDPYSAQLFEQQAKEICSQQAARTFLSLASAGKIPSWAMSYINFNLIQAAAK